MSCINENRRLGAAVSLSFATTAFGFIELVCLIADTSLLILLCGIVCNVPVLLGRFDTFSDTFEDVPCSYTVVAPALADLFNLLFDLLVISSFKTVSDVLSPLVLYVISDLFVAGSDKLDWRSEPETVSSSLFVMGLMPDMFALMVTESETIAAMLTVIDDFNVDPGIVVLLSGNKMLCCLSKHRLTHCLQ